MKRGKTAFKSTPKTACTAKPVTSKIHLKTSYGSRQKVVAVLTTPPCDALYVQPLKLRMQHRCHPRVA